MTHTDLAKMPVSEKNQPMESLWKNLSSSESNAAVIPVWHGDVLAQRQVMLDQGDKAIFAWSNAKQRIRSRTA